MHAAALLLGLLASSSGDPVRELALSFEGRDLDADERAEIELLRPIEGVDQGPAPGRLLLVLVEQRVLARGALDQSLAEFASDLAAEGYNPRVLCTRLYSGPEHQDGRTLLALREFFARARTLEPSLAGALLVGAFPEAFLVRTCAWRRVDDLVLHAGEPEEERLDAMPNLRVVPEPVAMTCDLVLCDLDGRWAGIYTKEREYLPQLVAAYPPQGSAAPLGGGITPHFERGALAFEDFFHVDDGLLAVGELRDEQAKVRALDVRPLDGFANRECSLLDLERPNPIARPEILLSRINARGVALQLKAGARDQAGRPRRIEGAVDQPLPSWADAPWEHDLVFEQRLLCEYLARNHAYRSGAQRASFRPAAIAHGLPSGFAEAKAAAAQWRDFAEPGFDVEQASLVDLVQWLQRPALLRTVRAHSDTWGSVFEVADLAVLEQLAGGTSWSYSPQGNGLQPSLQSACGGGKADFFLLRTLWENGVLPAGNASFYVHTGCDAITPAGFDHLPWSDPAYGLRQGAAALLFFGQGLALVGRAKVFYDEPRGFSAALAQGRNFGEAWASYFEIESRAADWSEVGDDIGRKRSYFWSLLGDWTLRLRE